MLKPGAYIKQGAMNWQVFQQTDGKADIHLSGISKGWPDDETGTVYTRVVCEDSGMPIVNWQTAEYKEGTQWRTVLRGVPVGGLYRIETCLMLPDSCQIEWAARGDMIHHIGVGDLFIIAGQSNAAGYGKDFVSDPPELGVHLLRNSGLWDMASHPLNESAGTDNKANEEFCNPGHSPYLSFAKRLKRTLGYPIGLLATALGGSPLSAWNPEEDGVLYNNMQDVIASAGGKIKAVLWYQGCSDAKQELCKTYLRRFGTMVERLRLDLGENTPFITTQINRDVRSATDEINLAWSMVREAQRQAAKHLEDVYVIPTLDLGLSDPIHNSASGNISLGERVAASALKNIYHKPFGYDAPDITHARQTTADEVELVFAPVLDHLYIFEEGDSVFEPYVRHLPFVLEDTNGTLPLTGCIIKGDTIILRTGRPLSGSAMVSAGAGQNPPGRMPIDAATRTPILAFYQVKVEEINDEKET